MHAVFLIPDYYNLLKSAINEEDIELHTNNNVQETVSQCNVLHDNQLIFFTRKWDQAFLVNCLSFHPNGILQVIFIIIVITIT